ncbi:hypothetical protein [Acetobacter cerevisiae]|uniref:hypothetical protein n=1 Tax=Acetobacter cerevisiae TaxID=178900 RepID=UPI000A8DBCC6|nr:hypothetical protein [Acetobacter cerevisiae]
MKNKNSGLEDKLGNFMKIKTPKERLAIFISIFGVFIVVDVIFLCTFFGSPSDENKNITNQVSEYASKVTSDIDTKKVQRNESSLEEQSNGDGLSSTSSSGNAEKEPTWSDPALHTPNPSGRDDGKNYDIACVATELKKCFSDESFASQAGVVQGDAEACKALTEKMCEVYSDGSYVNP